MVDQVKDVNELKEAIKSKRQEIIVSDHKLIRLIKVFKSVKNVAIVTSLLVSAGLLTAGILPIVLGAAAGAAASAAAGAAAASAAEETQKQDGTPQKVLKQIFKLRIK